MARKGMREAEQANLPTLKTELSNNFLPRTDHDPREEFQTPDMTV